MSVRGNSLTIHEKISFMSRFFKNVTPGPVNKCWNWLGCKKENGYGIISVRGQAVIAHRMFFYVLTGTEPAVDVFICHKCDNASCVNPLHLYAGSHADNMRDLSLSENNRFKLTKAKVKGIRRQIRLKKKTLTEIAKNYGVSVSLISAIKLSQRWHHLK